MSKRSSFPVLAIRLSLVVMSLLSFSVAAQVRFNIPSQPLARSLTAIASQAGLNIYFESVDVDGILAPALKAQLTPEAAISRLLTGTQLHIVRVNEHTFGVVTEENLQRAQNALHNTRLTYAGSETPLDLASALAVESADVPATDDRKDDRTVGNVSERAMNLQEVIVTAQKRSERLQDVPVPVTAISGDVLVNSNQLRLQDFYTQVPGLDVTPADGQGHGAPGLTIRGLTTGGGDPTVGVTIDDVPYGSSTVSNVPDIDPSELSRIEVLRGPQGTLYGASSMGGLVKFVTTDPSTEAVSGRLQSGFSGLHNGAQLGYNVRGAVNLPITDTLAARASAFTRQDPGYIDDVDTGQHGVNKSKVTGGRLSALWRPSEDLSLKLSALIQDSKSYGLSAVDLNMGLGDLQQHGLRGTGGYSDVVQAYSAILTAKLGDIQLTSITGYNIDRWSDVIDLGPLGIGPITESLYGPGITGTPYVDHFKTSKITQEIRLAASLGQRLDWLLGGFYTYESTPQETNIFAQDPLTLAVAGQWLNYIARYTFTEYAAFANFTWHFSERFDIQLGARESQNRLTNTSQYNGFNYNSLFNLTDVDVLTFPKLHAKGNAFTYLATPRFKVTPDLMVYARFASGYRPGGANSNVGVPPSYGPDYTSTYELGVKGDFLGHVLTLDASVYYVDWRDIQINVLYAPTSSTYNSNAGSAKSQGVELSAQVRPMTGLTIGGWLAWNDAELTKGFPQPGLTYGVAGDRLPRSSRFSGNLSLDQQFPITPTVSGFVGATVSYVGRRLGIFTGTPQREVFPPYAQTDARAGVTYDSWTVNAYCNNLTDRRGILNGGLGSSYDANGYFLIQPRSFGISVVKTFR